MTFEDLLSQRFLVQDALTEDVLASFLPLLRETAEAHRQQLTAPLEGTQLLKVEGIRLFFEEATRRPPRINLAEIGRLELAGEAAFDVLAETRRVTEVGGDGDQVVRSEVGIRGAAITRPIYLPGYISWEHEIGHHDPLTDAFTLGLILASMACRLNLNEPDDLEKFVANRRNLFGLNPQLHPVVAQTILRLTELDRRRRPQDLLELLRSLENYRDQPVPFDIDLARVPGFQTRDRKTRRAVVLAKLKERLFDLSRRNNLLHFRPTLQSINLTQSSIPLTIDIRNIREDQILVWDTSFQQKLVSGKPLSLNKHLNFAEALYLPSLLDRIIADTRRDQQEFGFAQLRLVACFLSWTNLKDKPVERYVSPLVLIPVRIIKTKGIRDTYSLEATGTDAEVNPVLRHQFKQLYNIDLPESIDLCETSLEALFDYLATKIQASEPAVTLAKIDRPRIDLVHDKAKRRLDQYRRSARVAGRGIRSFLDLDYSYDPANYHPLGVKLFSALVRIPGSHLREMVESKPRPRSFVAPQPDDKSIEVERTFYQLRDSTEENPYLWNFDLCAVTVANFSYRRMSLVRDYDAALGQDLTSPSFETTFSLAPRPLGRSLPTAPPLDERFDVVPCDPTQATAVAEARRGESYIIQGPPGTGKSQTITNLIADFIARGKRVLFVCEKRAAIDVVFARLRQSGLAPLCSLIHDSQTDKKGFILDLKQTYEMLSGELPGVNPQRNRDSCLQKLLGELNPLIQFDHVMETNSQLVGQPLRQFLDRCVELAPSLPVLSPEISERLPVYREWWERREQLAGIGRALIELQPEGVLARHPLRRLKPELATSERPLDTVRTASSQATEHLNRLRKVIANGRFTATAWRDLGRGAQFVEYMQRIKPLASHGNLALLDSKTPRARDFERAIAQLQQLEHSFAASQAATVRWKRKLPSDDLPSALAQARQWEGKTFAWLSLGWWRLRRILNESYDFKSHTIRPTWTFVLELLAQEYAAERELKTFVDAATAQFGNELSPTSLQQKLMDVRELLPGLPVWLNEIHAELLQAPEESSEQVREALEAYEPLEKIASVLAPAVADIDQLSLTALADELSAIQAHIHDVPQALSILRELAGLSPAISRTLREYPWNLREAEAAIAHRTWGQIVRDDRSLAHFDGRTRRQHISRLESHYDNWLDTNADEIRLRVRNRFLEHLQLTNLPAPQLSAEQREFKRAYLQGRRTLEHEFGKSMRYKSIRELVEGETSLVIRDLKPCWLMSPLSVSDALPLAVDFVDVVIFDEASQVPLEEAVPSIFRGKQVIVVGDEMQLPPTDFFATKRSDEEEGGGEVEDDGSDSVKYDLTGDSLLSHAARNLPSTMLGWHYRSRSESLISFSNWAFYDGRLLTVPELRLLHGAPVGEANQSPADLLLSRPISFHQLPVQSYENRRNRAEAEYIADLVADLLKRKHGASLGVIAFSEAQQDEIEKALQRLAGRDDEFRRLLEEETQREVDGQFVGLLVKNLENIQGDERDIILLSVCYGRAPNGKLIMNFGPINRSGGEKRLNVAFSRAKRHMAVISTLRADEIKNEYNEGAGCLKNYLRYAEAISAGDVDSAGRVLKGIARWQEPAAASEFENTDAVIAQLASLLRAQGVEVDEGVGQSHFRVDLAVRWPSDERYRLAILVDTAMQYEQSEPLERDVLRPRLLREFGWNVETVLAKDWYEHSGEELARLLKALDAGNLPAAGNASDGSKCVEP